jgi:hypothetical protein
VIAWTAGGATVPGRAPLLNRLTIPALLLLVALAARGQTFGNPVIGYDEQFYLLVGDRMLHGAVPFVDIFDRKPVGLFLVYAFIRMLGGEGTVQYQLVAGGFAFATALLIWRFAERVTGRTGAVVAAIGYLLWLDFLEGEAGQAPVFFNLPVLLAAIATARVVEKRGVTLLTGLIPMLLIGVAMQIKYTALFEGIFFGVAMLGVAWREGRGIAQLASFAAAWVLAALAPTLAAWLTYAAMGYGDAFLFANFVSMWGKLGDPWQTSAIGLLQIVGMLSPILLCAAFVPACADPGVAASRRFVRQWLLAAIAGMLVMRSFPSPHYAMPVLVPALIAAAPRFGQTGWTRRLVWGALAVAALASQAVLYKLHTLKGGAEQAARIAQAANPGRGCLYVYDGYPALYRLTNSCLPSRYVFPGHLNMANEASVAALGVDPSTEVRRIMATRPTAVVLDDPPFERGNHETYAIVLAELALHYDRVLALRTGKHRLRLVYRLRR